MKTSIAILATLVTVGTPAFTVLSANAQDAKPADAPADCLRTANIFDYTPVPGNRSLIVTDRARRQFKLTFAARCTGLQYHMGLQFRAFGSGLSCLARGDKVVTHDVAGPPECIITSIVPYTAQMRAADAKAAAAAKAGKD